MFRREVEEAVGRIDAACATLRSTPIHYINRTLTSAEVSALYCAGRHDAGEIAARRPEPRRNGERQRGGVRRPRLPAEIAESVLPTFLCALRPKYFATGTSVDEWRRIDMTMTKATSSNS